jgi:hypothetical protein
MSLDTTIKIPHNVPELMKNIALKEDVAAFRGAPEGDIY